MKGSDQTEFHRSLSTSVLLHISISNPNDRLKMILTKLSIDIMLQGAVNILEDGVKI